MIVIATWSLLAASVIAILLYLKFRQSAAANNHQDSNNPSLFENIHNMRAEVKSSIRQRFNSESSQNSQNSSQPSLKRRKNTAPASTTSFKKHNYYNIRDLLNSLGFSSDQDLNEIQASFEPVSVGPNVKLNTLINLQENIIIVQKGEVNMSFKSTSFEVSRVVQDGGVIYSKLAVIKYLINSPNRPEDVPQMETVKSCVLLKLPFQILKSKISEDIIPSAINAFIAELKKITIDLLQGELALPMTVMYKEHKVLTNDQPDIATLIAKKFQYEDVDFFRSRIIKFEIEQGESISIRGQTHDIGLALITKGSVRVQWSKQQTRDPYVIKDTWYGFICMLASSRGEPFPKSVAQEPTEGYIISRSTYQEIVRLKKDTVKICAYKMFKRIQPFTLKLYFFFNWITVKSGTVLYNKGDVAHGAFGVIRGRVRRPGGLVNQEESLICHGVYDCILERPRTDSVMATRSTELCYISIETIKAFKNWFPTVQNMLLKGLGEQLFDAWKNKTVPKKKQPSQLKAKAITVIAATDNVPLSRVTTDFVYGLTLNHAPSISVIKISSRKILRWNSAFVFQKDFDPETNPHLLGKTQLGNKEYVFHVMNIYF